MFKLANMRTYAMLVLIIGTKYAIGSEGKLSFYYILESALISDNLGPIFKLYHSVDLFQIM